MTLVDRLIPKVASIRGRVHGAVGDRPYHVFIVTASWTGGEPGRGHQTTKRVELGCGKSATGSIVPPKLVSRQAFNPEAQGIVETGGVTVTEIDPGLLEKDMESFLALGPGDETYVEVTSDRGPTRRYRVSGIPWFDGDRIYWSLALEPQQGGAA